MAFGHFIVRDLEPGHGRLLRSMMAPQPSTASSTDRFRRCYGPEFVAKAVRGWIDAVGAKTAFIEPGSPWENGYCESFNSKLRDELLNGKIFYSLAEARVVIEAWRVHYNTARPTRPSAIDRPRRRPFTGRPATADHPRHRQRHWCRDPSCTKIETGPPDRGRPK